MLKSMLNALAAVGFLFLVMTALAVGVSHAHTGSPTPTTWSNGNVLTATNLNDTIAHLHNTFNGGIVDSHISGTAAIAHSKFATPALVAKAVLSTTTPCVGGGALGTDCTTGVEHSKFLATNGGAGSGNSAIEATAENGRYDLTLSYTPTDSNFMVNATAGTAGMLCAVIGRSTTAPHIRIDCQTDAAANVDTNVTVVVFDTN